jgi:hypothetical protein
MTQQQHHHPSPWDPQPRPSQQPTPTSGEPPPHPRPALGQQAPHDRHDGAVPPTGVHTVVGRYEPALATKVLVAAWMVLVLVFSGVGAYAGLDWLVTKARIRQAVEQFSNGLQQGLSDLTTP